MAKKYSEKAKYLGKVSDKFIEETRVVCKCGHSVNFFSKIPYLECTHCHNIIFRNKKAEYDYRIKRRMGVSKK